MGLFSRTSIGVDLGRSSVRVVGLKLSKHPEVLGFAEVPVGREFLERDGLKDPAVVGKAIRQAMKEAHPHHLSTAPAFASVSEASVFRKVLELPIMQDEEEYRGVIRAQAAEYLPDSLENIELDYQLLGALPDAATQQVMVAAIGKRTVEDYIAVFKSAKLTLQGLDPKPSSVGRAVVGPKENGTVVLIDIGSENSSISVYENHVVWVTGTANVGTKLLQGNEEKDGTAVKQLTTALLDEFEHVIKFYANRTAKQNLPKEVRLSGSGASIKGLVDALDKEITQKVVVGKPIIEVPENFDHRFYGALGCALYPMYELL